MVCACRSTAADPPPADDDASSETSASSTGSTGSETTFSGPLTCTQTSECAETPTPFCVAPYDPGTGTIGAAACVEECVPAGDLARACRDDAACCDELRCNRVDGFCAAEPVASTSSGTEGDTDTDTTSGGGSGDPSSSSSGSSSSSSGSGSTTGGTEG